MKIDWSEIRLEILRGGIYTSPRDCKESWGARWSRDLDHFHFGLAIGRSGVVEMASDAGFSEQFKSCPFHPGMGFVNVPGRFYRILFDSKKPITNIGVCYELYDRDGRRLSAEGFPWECALELYNYAFVNDCLRKVIQFFNRNMQEAARGLLLGMLIETYHYRDLNRKKPLMYLNPSYRKLNDQLLQIEARPHERRPVDGMARGGGHEPGALPPRV